MVGKIIIQRLTLATVHVTLHVNPIRSHHIYLVKHALVQLNAYCLYSMHTKVMDVHKLYQ
jgi:hypothetical protein